MLALPRSTGASFVGMQQQKRREMNEMAIQIVVLTTLKCCAPHRVSRVMVSVAHHQRVYPQHWLLCHFGFY
jgi:hypothetical protein